MSAEVLSVYDEALRALKAGELIGVFPEATISRSFEVKGLKTGAARMAMDTGVPLIPVAVWGGQRLMTKGRKPSLRRRTPILIFVGPPIPISPTDDVTTVTDRLAVALKGLLARAQDEYPDAPSGPDDRWWLPAARGGTAPTVEEAHAMDVRDYPHR